MDHGETNGERIAQAKRDVAYFMRRLYRQGLTTTSGGNISVRLDDETLLMTPSGLDKARTRSEEIGRMAFDGTVLDDGFKPSIEAGMHIQIYSNRDDVQAIVHAHSSAASVIAATDAEVNTHYLSETYAILGDAAHVDYHAMGSNDLAVAVGAAVRDAECAIMRNHGALAVGKTLLQAFDRLEVLENAAKTTIVNQCLLRDVAQKIDEDGLRVIDGMMGRPPRA